MIDFVWMLQYPVPLAFCEHLLEYAMTDSAITTTWPELLLRKHAPHLVEHLGLTAREWTVLQEKAGARMERINDLILNNGETTVPATLLDHAVKVEIDRMMGRNDARASASFLQFLDAVVLDLVGQLPPKLMPTLRLQMRDIFINFSVEQSKYKEKLGELLAINHLGHRLGAQPVALEVPVEGRPTTLDVELALPLGSRVPVEILNVQLTDSRVEDEVGLMAFIDGRIRNKVQQKLGVDASDLSFPLQLIVWFQRDETLQKYGPALAARGTTSPFELPICTLRLLGDGGDRFDWRFGPIADLMRSK